MLDNLPPTEKQMRYARTLAQRTNSVLPWEIQQDRQSLSRWIDAQQEKSRQAQHSDTPTSKQVAYAERIARARRRDVPDECYRSRALLSRWIDSNRF